MARGQQIIVKPTRPTAANVGIIGHATNHLLQMLTRVKIAVALAIARGSSARLKIQQRVFGRDESTTDSRTCGGVGRVAVHGLGAMTIAGIAHKLRRHYAGVLARGPSRMRCATGRALIARAGAMGRGVLPHFTRNAAADRFPTLPLPWLVVSGHALCVCVRAPHSGAATIGAAANPATRAWITAA